MEPPGGAETILLTRPPNSPLLESYPKPQLYSTIEVIFLWLLYTCNLCIFTSHTHITATTTTV